MDIKDGELVLKASGWDHLYIPAPTESKFAISGEESQIVTFKLGVGEEVKGEPGTMMFLSAGLKPALVYEGCCSRCISGESCCVVSYINSGAGGKNTAYAALTPNFPTSKVVPVDLSSIDVNGSLITQQGAFMASYGDVHVTHSFDCNFMRCCCAGLGLIRQKLKGDGTVFLESTGTIVQTVLVPGEIIVVDTDCVLAFAESVKIDLKKAGSLLGMLGGGEGIFNTVLTGPGLVLIQSMSQETFRAALVANKLYRR